MNTPITDRSSHHFLRGLHLGPPRKRGETPPQPPCHPVPQQPGPAFPGPTAPGPRPTVAGLRDPQVAAHVHGVLAETQSYVARKSVEADRALVRSGSGV